MLGWTLDPSASPCLGHRIGRRQARRNAPAGARTNDVLERQIEDLLTRPRGRPSYAPLVRYRSFHYQAASWKRPRRVIAKVEHHLGELIKEGKTATHWTRLSCHRFRANEVRLLLGVIAYNLGNLLRRLVLPVAIQDWSLTSLHQRLLKTGDV